MNERSILRPFVLFVCEMWEICSSIKSNLLLGYTILSYIIIVRMHYIPTCTVYRHDNETIIISLKAKMYCIPSNNRDESFRLGEMCVVGRRREFPSDLQQQKGVPTQIPLYPPSCQSQNMDFHAKEAKILALDSSLIIVQLCPWCQTFSYFLTRSQIWQISHKFVQNKQQ